MAASTGEVNHRLPSESSPECADLQAIRRFGDARNTADYASRSHQAKAYRNIPSSKAEDSLPDVVAVRDPSHPLFGKSFRVVRVSTHRGGNFAPSYEVEHCAGISLLIPIASTEEPGPSEHLTKLSVEGLEELISVVGQLEDERRSKGCLDDAAAQLAAAGRRRNRRSIGGDVS